MTELPPLPEARPGRYRHYKGGERGSLDEIQGLRD